MKYRKRPIVIDAVRYGEDDDGRWYSGAVKRVALFMLGRGVDESASESEMLEVLAPGGVWDPPEFANLIIATLEGDMIVRPGDFVIKGVQGEFYPCNPYIFEATYEAVTDDVA